MTDANTASASVESLDEVLAAKARTDRDAFSELYRRYLDAIYRFMRYQAPDDEAQDLTAQVFFHAYRAAGQFRGNGTTYRAWLFKIAHNTVVTWRRKRARLPVPLPELPEHVDDSPEIVEWSPPPDVRVAVHRVVQELPPGDRQLIELRYVEGLQAPEIAEVTGSTSGAVRVRLHRLIRRLRSGLEARGVAL